MSELEKIEAKIKTYQGLKERAEWVKTVSNITVVDPKTLIWALADIIIKMLDINIIRAEQAEEMTKKLEKLAIQG